MAIVYIPVIRADDYHAFERILRPHMPHTFDAWGELLTKKAAKAMGQGDTVRNVKVDPDEFARYLNATNADHNLDDFAAEKSSGKSY